MAHAVTVTQYDHALAAVQYALQSQVHALKSPKPNQGKDKVNRTLSALQQIKLVGASGQPEQYVENTQLIDNINNAETKGSLKNIQAAIKQIVVLRASFVNPSKTPQLKQDPVLLERQIAAEPEFLSKPLPPPTIMDRFTGWLIRIWNKLFNKKPKNQLDMKPPAISLLFIHTLLVIVAVAASALLLVIITQMLKGQQFRKSSSVQWDKAESELLEARDRNSLIALAEAQLREGDYRRAYRLIFLATLLLLDNEGALRFDRSKTNWEYLRALRNGGFETSYKILRPLAQDFDRIWYGYAPVTHALCEDTLAYYRSLETRSHSFKDAAAPAQLSAG